MNNENLNKLMDKLNGMYDDITKDEVTTYIDKYMEDDEAIDSIFGYICRHKAGLYDRKVNIQEEISNQLESGKIIIKNDSEYNDFIDNTLEKFNLFENNFETNKMKINKDIINIKEIWIEVSKENLLDVAEFKEYIKNNTNIEVETFNFTLK